MANASTSAIFLVVAKVLLVLVRQLSSVEAISM